HSSMSSLNVWWIVSRAGWNRGKLDRPIRVLGSDSPAGRMSAREHSSPTLAVPGSQLSLGRRNFRSVLGLLAIPASSGLLMRSRTGIADVLSWDDLAKSAPR